MFPPMDPGGTIPPGPGGRSVRRPPAPEGFGRVAQGVAVVAAVTLVASGVLLTLAALGVTPVRSRARRVTIAAAAPASVQSGVPQPVVPRAAGPFDSAPPPATVAPPPTPAGPGSLTVMPVSGPASPTARAVYVYRPAVPDSSSLPVVYFLHGVPGGPADPFDAGLARYLDRAFAAGTPPFVVVAPDGNGTRHDDTEWVDAADGTDRIESFLVDEVIPAVEGSRPRDRAHRAVAGDSMGAYGAMNLAMRHPDLFGQVVSIAGYFHVDDPAGMLGGQPQLIEANSPDRHPSSVAGTHILLVDGTEESDPVIRGESARMQGLLASVGIASRLVLAQGDDTWELASSQWATITDFLEAGWPTRR